MPGLNIILQWAALFLAALVAGTLNSVAGGGSFLSTPTLMFTGVPPINANATNTMALWPGSVASVGAYRDKFDGERRPLFLLLGGVSLVGGVLGAILLLRTPEQTFVRLFPFLLLVASLLFTFGGTIAAKLRKRFSHEGETNKRPTWMMLLGIGTIQMIIAIYGGYFGGGIGIMMLAALALTGMEDIHAMNAIKTLLATCINGVAVVTFVLAGTIFWPQALVMVVGAIIGGYAGARFARRIDPKLIRRFVIFVGFTMTIYFFLFPKA